MDGYSGSEQTAHKYFRDLGFVVEVPRKGARRGYDFLLSLDYEGERYSVTVEVKQHRSESLLSPQLDNIRNNGGLLVVSRNGEVRDIFTKDNIKTEREITKILRRYTIKWK